MTITPVRASLRLPSSVRFARALAAVLGFGALAAAACGHEAPRRAKGAASRGPARAAAGATAGAARPGEAVAPIELSDEALCALPAAPAAAALPGAAPFSSPEVPCPEGGDSFCDVVERSPDPGDACFVANDNLARAEGAARVAGRGRPAPRDPWDGATKPRFLDRVDAHLHLTPGEHALLRRNGFVVLDRLAYDNYANAFHDIFQEQLPLYVGIDPVLHAVFRGTELVLERVERRRLMPALDALLAKLRAGLAASRGRYDRETLDDLDVYLGVARELASRDAEGAEAADLAPPARPPAAGGGASEGPGAGRRRREPVSLFGHEAQVLALAGRARGEGGLEAIELFGRPRVVDFSQLTPRGRYAAGEPGDGARTRRYFRAMMWLTRLEFNLVSRSCKSSHPGAAPDPGETPREARDALALAELVARSGALGELAAFDEAYGAFAGGREDVSAPELLRLMRAGRFSARDPDAPGRLRAAIGGGFRRTARVHFMPEGAAELPAIATLFGPRIVPDVAPLTGLVHDRVPDRYALGAADVAAVLGHDQALRSLAPELAEHPALGGALQAAREGLRATAAGRDDAYGGWLRAVLALAAPPRGVVPSFLGREAYAGARINSALVGYGRLRRAFVLLAGQGYDAYGCEIPDGYVEPLPEVYDALLAHVRRLRATAGGFAGLERVLTTLRAAVATEVSGAELAEPQRRWLGMVAEHRPRGGLGFVDSGAPPKWTGWYFDMFEDRELGASESVAFVADYFTLSNRGEVAYLGAEGPRLGVFVVDVNGEPRAMVGPVAKGYEVRAPIAGRLDDAKAAALGPKRAPWREGYAAPAPPEPALGLAGKVVRCAGGAAGSAWRVVLRAERALGPVRVALLDHHGDPLVAPLRLDVGAGLTPFAFALPAAFDKAKFGVEGLHVRIDDLARAGAGRGAYDFFTSPSVFADGSRDEASTAAGELRPRGLGPFVLDGDPATPPGGQGPNAAPASPFAPGPLRPEGEQAGEGL